MIDPTNNLYFKTQYDQPETCSICLGPKFVLGTLGNSRWLQCRDCGMQSTQPIENGVVMTSHEEIIDE